MAEPYHWTPQRKLALVQQITRDEITADEAMTQHGISAEELSEWTERLSEGGPKGLRLTGRPTAAEFLETFAYDSETGIITWLKNVGTLGRIGKEAGSIWRTPRGDPYRIIRFRRRGYRAHQIAWLLKTGEWPKGLIDHRDCDGLNNRWSNLRAATSAQNVWNSRSHKRGECGLKGVRLGGNRYVARIQAGGVRTTIGSFDTAAEAHRAYCAAGQRLHGEFFNDGGPPAQP